MPVLRIALLSSADIVPDGEHIRCVTFRPNQVNFRLMRVEFCHATMRVGEQVSTALVLLLAHDLFRRPVSTFRDHALADRAGGTSISPVGGPEFANERIGPRLPARSLLIHGNAFAI